MDHMGLVCVVPFIMSSQNEDMVVIVERQRAESENS